MPDRVLKIAGEFISEWAVKMDSQVMETKICGHEAYATVAHVQGGKDLERGVIIYIPRTSLVRLIREGVIQDQ